LPSAPTYKGTQNENNHQMKTSGLSPSLVRLQLHTSYGLHLNKPQAVYRQPYRSKPVDASLLAVFEKNQKIASHRASTGCAYRCLALIKRIPQADVGTPRLLDILALHVLEIGMHLEVAGQRHRQANAHFPRVPCRSLLKRWPLTLTSLSRANS